MQRKIQILIHGLLVLALSPHTYAQSGDAVQEDPHWSRHSCQVCHQDAMPTPDNLGLKSAVPEQLCAGCHGSGGDASPCRHVSDVLPGIFADRLPPSYEAHLDNGKIVCTTCHDLTVQCKNPKRTLQYKNPGFVRDGRFSNSSEQCYLCHEVSNFEKVNPHEQAEEGADNSGCLLCHANQPQQNEDSSWQPVDFNMTTDLNDTCRGCHPVQSHPATMSYSRKQPEWAHLVVPQGEVLKNMSEYAESSGVVLPLDPRDGKVYCATCHNPHHDQLPSYPTAEPPGSDYRLRTEEMCDVCHDK